MATEEIPRPLLERGDFVRLKRPYEPGDVSFRKPIRIAFKALAQQRAEELGHDWVEDYPVSIGIFRGDKDYEDLFQFTHGTIVEVVSRYASGDPKNVSLHLFNPETGLMYVHGHPTEPGAPMFVDHHVGELVLIHKYNEKWGNEYELDVAEVYDDRGVQTFPIDPEEDDG